MASQKPRCWTPLQKAPRLTELSLYSEEDLLIIGRLQKKYNCSSFPCKTEWAPPPNYPEPKPAATPLPMKETEIKREPLSPVSSSGPHCPSVTAPVTVVRRSALGPASQSRSQDSASWPTAAATDNPPAVCSPGTWEHRHHPFPVSYHANSLRPEHSMDFVDDSMGKEGMTGPYGDATSPPNCFPFLGKDKPSLHTSVPSARRRHRDDVGSVWDDAGIQWGCSGVLDRVSCMSPRFRKRSLQQELREHPVVTGHAALHPHTMFGHHKISPTDRRSGQDATSKTTKTSARKITQTAVSADIRGHSKPTLNLSEGKDFSTALVGNVSSCGTIAAGKKHKRTPVSETKYVNTTPKLTTQHFTTSAGSIDQESCFQPRSKRTPPVSTVVTMNTSLCPTPAGLGMDRGPAVGCNKRGENGPWARPKTGTSSDKAAGRGKIQRELTSYSGIVKKKKTARPSERGPAVKEAEKEGEEDPLSGIIRDARHLSDGTQEDGQKPASTGQGGVREVVAMTSQQRERLAGVLEKCRLVSLLVLYEDGTTNTDSSLFTRPKVEGLLLHCEEESYLFPVPEKCDDVSTNQWVRGVLDSVLKKEDTVRVAVNCKHLVISLLRDFCLGKHREAVGWRFEDPLVGGWLLKPDHPPHSLHALCRSLHLRYSPEEGAESGLRVSLVAMARVRAGLGEHQLWPLFSQVEMALCPLLAAMELQPLAVSPHAFRHFSAVLKKKIDKVEKKAYQLAGHSFCINSPQQLRQLLYEELRLDQQLPGSRKVTLTASAGHKSTSEAVLKQLAPLHPLPAVILEYRHLCKLKSTYIDGMLECVKGGVVHTHWDQTSAATGRLVSAHPNLQAIPKTPTLITDYDDNFIVGAEAKSCEIYAREPFIASDGHVFLAADFQQIELRLLAHLASDRALRAMFRPGPWQSADIFIQLTALWLSKACADVTHAEREQTKRVVYSILYGVGKERLAEYLKVSSSRAKDIMDSFLVSFPAIQVFTKRCVDYAQKHGYTETVMGRKRWLSGVHDQAPSVRAQAQRQAVNFCVQGSAADLCKRAMVRVEEALRDQPHLSARLLMHIHDELVWEVPQDQLSEMCGLVKGVMEDDALLCRPLLPCLTVPITVSLSSGTSWAHLFPCP